MSYRFKFTVSSRPYCPSLLRQDGPFFNKRGMNLRYRLLAGRTRRKTPVLRPHNQSVLGHSRSLGRSFSQRQTTTLASDEVLFIGAIPARCYRSSRASQAV